MVNNVLDYCQSFISSIPHYLNIIPPVLLLSLIILLVIRLLTFYFKSQSLKSKLSKLIISENKEKKIAVVKSQEKFAFVLGIRRPKIYVSKGLISNLSKEELKAVLLHEHYHLEKRDTFIMLITSIVNSISFLFPILRDVIKNYKISREVEADKFAVIKSGDNRALVSALSKILAAPAISTYYAASIAEHETLEERILALVSKNPKKGRFKLLNLAITFLSLLFIVVIIAMPVYANSLSGESASLCADKSIGKPYSEDPPAYTPIK